MFGHLSSSLKTVAHSATNLKTKVTAFTTLSILITGLVIALLSPAIATTIVAHADASCSPNGITLSGSSWLSGGGVNICNNGSSSADDYGASCVAVSGAPGDSHCPKGYVYAGEKWQCVELVNRLYLTKGWTKATWWGNGNTLVNNVPSGLVKQNNGSISYVNPGDVITLNDGGFGHAGIINSIDSNGTLHIKNQNIGSTTGSSAYIDSGSLGNGNAHYHMNGWSTYKVQAIIHAPSSGSNLVTNGGFNANASHWSTTASANMVQYPGNSNQASYEGAGYLATNSPQINGSVYQDIPLTIASGNMYCAEAELTSIGSSGGNGTLAIWLNGGNNTESSSYIFSNLSTAWTPVKTCITATTSHTKIRVQIYDNVGSSTIGIDAVDVHKSTISNGEFNVNASHWSTTMNANMVQYPGNSNQPSYEGAGYLATNSPQSDGSVYQDITPTIASGDMYCAEAEITSIGSSGASGTLAIWMPDGSHSESSSYMFSNLPTAWKPFKTCVTATTSHNKIRVQVYDNVGSPTIGIDAVDVHKSLVTNGEFNANAGHWSTTVGANMVQYPGNSNQASYEGAGYLTTNSPRINGSVYQDIPLTIISGNMYCAEAELTSIGSSGASGTLTIWLNGGNNNESSSHVFSNLPSAWTPFKTCVTATTSHTTIRVQVYDNVGSPTIGVDAVDAH